MNTLPILTWSDFDLFEPCYSPQERYGDFSGTILEILKDERIPNDDKIWAAAWDAARAAAAWDAARAAAWDAEWAAAWDAARDAARAAARDAQVKLLIEIIETHYACKAIKEGER